MSDHTTYRHGTLGPRPVDFDEAVRLLGLVTRAYAEVIEELGDYDDDHPELWGGCAEHPDGDCGYRDLPSFYIHALVTSCDVRDAQAFLAAHPEAV